MGVKFRRTGQETAIVGYEPQSLKRSHQEFPHFFASKQRSDDIQKVDNPLTCFQLPSENFTVDPAGGWIPQQLVVRRTQPVEASGAHDHEVQAGVLSLEQVAGSQGDGELRTNRMDRG